MESVARSLAGLSIALACAAGAACKVEDPLYCDPEHPCTDPQRSYCDLRGEHPGSEGIGRTCIADPFGVDAGGMAGLDAGLGTACVETVCENDQLRVCGTSGTVVGVEYCLLGCASEEARCLSLVASNGLTELLDESSDEEPVSLADGATIDTDEGAVRSSQGDPLPVVTTTVAQSVGPTLRVFIAGAWTLGDVRVQGSLPAAFVSVGDIVVVGLVDASADGATSGPGAVPCEVGSGGGAAPTAGHFSRHPSYGPLYPQFFWDTNGSGGGGWGTAGGDGGSLPTYADRIARGGLPGTQEALVPIRGGCEGGAENPAYRGGGGGALQLVSAGEIRLVKSRERKATIHVGGGGGGAGLPLGRDDIDDPIELFGSGAGGSGGSVLIEAPSVRLEPGTSLLAGGGGGGGYGACSPSPAGEDAPADGSAASGGRCGEEVWPPAGGDGAIDGNGDVGDNTVDGPAGSGGGGLGRIRINDHQEKPDVNAGLIRGVLSKGIVGRR